MKVRQKKCAYCGQNTATEIDHVIAKQFFPAEEKYRADIPRVPSCSICNRLKQKVEDYPGFFLLWGSNTEAAQQVLTKRAKATVAKNKKFASIFNDCFKTKYVTMQSGLIVKRSIIELPDQVLANFREWFLYITKGLYFHEHGTYLVQNNKLLLLFPTDVEQFSFFQNMIFNTVGNTQGSVANGEFEYIFATNNAEELTMWMFSFCQVTVVAVTLGPKVPDTLIAEIEEMSWK